MEHMKMVSMKRPKMKSKKMEDAIEVPSHEDYPYGLQIHMNKEELKKLGLDIDDMSMDMKFKIHGEAMVKELSKNVSSGDSRMSATFQITDMGCEMMGSKNPKKLKDAYKSSKSSHKGY